MAVMRPGPRTIFIKLKRGGRVGNYTTVGDYVVESLRNAASVSVDPECTNTPILRVGDGVSQLQADILCQTNYYEVTINI